MNHVTQIMWLSFWLQPVWLIPCYTSEWQRHTCVNNLSGFIRGWEPERQSGDCYWLVCPKASWTGLIWRLPKMIMQHGLESKQWSCIAFH